jgi:two-component system, chemotaxis family, protein-glutamate methylesterase/glutaminase
MIRVLIADDSPLVRRILTDLLQQEDDITVAGCACNGREAVELTLALQPDLVLMDLVMPELDGLEAIEEIMAGAPTPVLVLSAALESNEVQSAFNAIKRGALDVMEKPAADVPGALEEFALRLTEKVRLLSRVRVIRHPRRRVRRQPEAAPAAAGPAPTILAIGASTGGPKAVMTLLKALPADFPGAVFVVQHIAQGFAAGFATWLDRECALKVRLAVDGERYGAGEAVIAPDGRHLTVRDGRIRLIDELPVNCCRPSIDVFFNSLAEVPCEDVVGCLLTGMGKDGARGLLRVKQRGGTTLVQDEPSCAVFGMPKAAIEMQAVSRVLPLEQMPAAIAGLFHSHADPDRPQQAMVQNLGN